MGTHMIALQFTIGDTAHHTISAASGMVALGADIFVIGDNSANVYQLDSQLNIVRTLLLKEYPLNDDGVIKKRLKPDFEAMAYFEWQQQPWLLIVGSGSRPTRELAFMLHINEPEQRYEKSLTALYQQFYHTANLQGEQKLNIEGLTIANEHVYFFNRGNASCNLIFSLPHAQLMAYLTGAATQVEQLHCIKVQLPIINDIEAGFSSAEYWPQINALLYTASIEATKNAYNDGAIFGSLIGLIPLPQLHNQTTLNLTTHAHVLTREGKPLITKVEALTLIESTANSALGIIASDNDDGSSEFFKITFVIPEIGLAAMRLTQDDN